MKDDNTRELIRFVKDYKQGSTNLETASHLVSDISGLMPEVAQAFLKHMKRDNVIELKFKNDRVEKDQKNEK